MAILLVQSAVWAETSLFTNLEKPQDFVAQREGSYDRSGGNDDWRSIEPGQELLLADIKGPGRIVHFWWTIAAEAIPQYNRALVLRMYWDGEKQPSVESPLGDFFCNGHGMFAMVGSLPISVTEYGGRNCWLPMPFKKSARITLTNDADKPVRMFFWNIDWQRPPSLPEDTRYFHAQYRQEFPTIKGKDYAILDANGQGHYVGVALSVEKESKPGWFGEGDERMCVDGQSEPSIIGTGTEDYFITAWGPHVYNSPWAGYSFMQGYKTLGDKSTAYRFHILDPIPFTRSIRVSIEHAWDQQNSDFCDNYSSVAYWYQTEPHQSFAPLPTFDQRRPRY